VPVVVERVAETILMLGLSTLNNIVVELDAPLLPLLSMTVNVTVKFPAYKYTCEYTRNVLLPVTVGDWSPKLHE
jgi:hypothetical protein